MENQITVADPTPENGTTQTVEIKRQPKIELITFDQLTPLQKYFRNEYMKQNSKAYFHRMANKK